MISILWNSSYSSCTIPINKNMAKILYVFVSCLLIAFAEHDHTRHISPDKIREIIQTVSTKGVTGY